MARKLPWLATASRDARKGRHDAPQKSDAEGGDSVSDPAPPRRRKPPTERNRSSSPPPAPPEEVFMRDGFEADDGYIQVEDEFMSTAQAFTRHLHHAEYQRQKQLAKSKNAGAVQNITRPVDARTQLSLESKKRLEGEEQRRRGRVAITNIYGSRRDESEEEEDDPWLRDPRLAGLMSQKEMSAPLGKITGVQSTSRAAMGYSQGQASPSKRRTAAADTYSLVKDECGEDIGPRFHQLVSVEIDENDSDDLDALSYRTSPSRKRQETKPLQAASALQESPAKLRKLPRKANTTITKSDERVEIPSATSHEGNSKDIEDDVDLFAPFPLRRYRPNEPRPIAKAQVLTKKKMEADKRKQPLKADEIPTFLV